MRNSKKANVSKWMCGRKWGLRRSQGSDHSLDHTGQSLGTQWVLQVKEWHDLIYTHLMPWWEQTLPRQIVRCVWKIFLWVLSREQILDAQHQEQEPGNRWMLLAPFNFSHLFTWNPIYFSNFYIEFQLWLLLVYRSNLIVPWSFRNSPMSHQLMATFLTYYLLKNI